MRVVVVGAGIVGASVTYHLARRGVSVTLIDREAAPAAGVTGGSFAWFGGRSGDWPGGAEDLRGSVLADYRRLEAELPDVEVRRSGSLIWHGSAAEARPDEGQYLVGRDGIRALEPGLRTPPEWVVHTPSDGGVDPVTVTRALVRASGAQVILGATGVALKVDGERSEMGVPPAGGWGKVTGVTSSAGFHPASTVVLAAGTGITELIEPLGVGLPLAASPACLVRLTAPPGLVRTIVSGPDVEVREVRDGQLLMTVPVAASPEEGALRRLRAAFRGADDCRVLGSLVGARPMPADGPLVGPLTPDGSVYVAVMHSAVTLAPTVGRLVAQELVTGKPVAELSRCRPSSTGRNPATAC
ncbi:NAD(P)/FAD-dependent oxidoreductase [Streptomyces dysideae]|uniref:NAD(P)/FAD-dependent oxidoreductase n=1 Tax=Streptomyces dysideae TaxID=909626 RepID=UPI00099E5138|nr:FAD-dependent oxidoreductase [Streptomyces dysideae]